MPVLIPHFSDLTHDKISHALQDALDCPQCLSDWRAFTVMSEGTKRPRFCVQCTRCKYTGQFGKHVTAAIKQWNKAPTFLSDLINAIKRKWGK